MTGNYFFLAPNTISSGADLMLEYVPSAIPLLSPLPTSQPSSLVFEDPEALASLNPHICLGRDSQNEYETKSMKGDEQQWNSKQINDFVHKLGFLDTGEESGDKIKDFLHISEVCMHWDTFAIVC